MPRYAHSLNTLLIYFFLTSISISISASEPSLLRNINTHTTPQYSYPNQLTNFKDDLYFSAYNGSSNSLYIFDGNEASVIYSGEVSTITAAEDALYFFHDGDLWHTDSPPGRPQLVKSFPNSGITTSVSVNNKIYFNQTNGGLWVSNGTTNGTTPVLDNAGNSVAASGDLTPAGNKVFFQIENNLWVLDSTTNSAMKLREFSSQSFNSFIAFGNQLAFIVDSSIWVSDGSTNGTQELVNLLDFSTNPSPTLDQLTAAKDLLFFRFDDGIHGNEPWVTDGSTLGTKMLVDSYTRSSTISDDYEEGYGFSHLIESNGYIFFDAANGLWKSDGTPNGTSLIFEYYYTYRDSANALVAAGNFVYLSAGYGRPLFSTDITTTETSQIMSFHCHISIETYGDDQLDYCPENFIAIDDKLYFSAGEYPLGVELWSSDGYQHGTRTVANINPDEDSSTPKSFTKTGGTTYFSAFNEDYGRELWATDSNSTWLIEDIYPGYYEYTPVYWYYEKIIYESTPDQLASLNNNLVFVALSGYDLPCDPCYPQRIGRGLWTSDGTAAGTQEFFTKPDLNPQALTIIGDKIFFIDGYSNSLFVSDGTNTGTKEITGVEAYTSTTAAFGSNFFFLGKLDTDTEPTLWRSDGTTSGTQKVLTSVSGEEIKEIEFLTKIEDKLFFSAANSNQDKELWAIDGITFEAKLVKNINPFGSSNPDNFVGLNGMIYFTADDGLHGKELWVTEGTAASTQLVKDINIQQGSNPSNLATLNGKLYFQADDGNTGSELWVSDGTTSGTKLVSDISFNSSSPTDLTSLGGKLYFTANDGINGRELWESDGTSFGTRIVSDIYPGPDSSNPSELADIGDTLYFSASNGINGREPWSLTVEINTATIGDLVWNDLDEDGQQDPNEPGLSGVTVNLWMNCDSNNKLTTVTNADGFYYFDELAAGKYRLEFVKPKGYAFSPEKAAGDYKLDSNANQSSGLDSCRTLSKGNQRNALDAGLYQDGPIVDTLTVQGIVAGTQQGQDTLWIRASSTATPAGSSNITAYYLSDGKEVLLGNLGWKATKGFYQQKFKGLTCTPETIVLYSEAGARLERQTPYPGNCDNTSIDNVEVVKAIYFSSQNKLWIRGISDITPSGSADIVASITTNTDTVELGSLSWNSSKNAYQKSFFNITKAPDTVSITSSNGGTASTAVKVVH